MSTKKEIYNEDELEPPKWLNEDFVCSVLQTSEKDETIKVKSLKITPATLQGDHYASIMFRARVEYQSDQHKELQSMSIIVKTMPEVDGTKKDLLEGSYLFETEIGMYMDVMPKLESILQAAGDNTKFAPSCLYGSLSPKKVLVFEDIVPKNYQVRRELGIEEVKAAFLKLAKIHAVSYKIHQENSNYFEKYQHSISSLSNMVESEIFTGGIDNFIEMLDKVPSLLKYKPNFLAMQPQLHAKFKATYEEYNRNPKKDAHYVLCHGDFHIKNMMFRHKAEDSSLEDVLLLDFQLSYIGPMVNDVIYGVYMLMSREMRKNNYDEILYYYFSNFVDTLRQIDYKGRIPKLIEFRQMLLEHRHFNIFLLVTFLPMTTGFFGGEINPEEMMTNADFRKSLYTNSRYVEELEECLPRLLHMGYLDD